MHSGFLIYTLLLLFSISINAQLRGKIVKVQDGDTVTLLDSTNTQHKIRLHGIDAPEKGQSFGNKSKEHLSGLIEGKEVVVDVKGTDRYKRVLGVIYLGDKNINAEMIRAGYAWNYKYSKDKYYIKLQEKAKEERKGLWVDKNPIDPWAWRKDKKPTYTTSEAKIYTSDKAPNVYHRSSSCPELVKYKSEVIQHRFDETKGRVTCMMCSR